MANECDRECDGALILPGHVPGFSLVPVHMLLTVGILQSFAWWLLTDAANFAIGAPFIQDPIKVLFDEF